MAFLSSLCDLAGEMMELSATAATTSFPVVFFNEEWEVDIGTIAVHRALGFKKFQAVISQKIGIAPHQISFSLVRRKKARTSPKARRKVPIEESSDFTAITRELNIFALAACHHRHLLHCSHLEASSEPLRPSPSTRRSPPSPTSPSSTTLSSPARNPSPSSPSPDPPEPLAVSAFLVTAPTTGSPPPLPLSPHDTKDTPGSTRGRSRDK